MYIFSAVALQSFEQSREIKAHRFKEHSPSKANRRRDAKELKQRTFWCLRNENSPIGSPCLSVCLHMKLDNN
jgi:hypothetical protein